ncbi:MAG: hypothetical protein NZM12_10930 [Steroidobacteraceae bacterium]|nr:hypothetical protein [Steroidobacteraceae bacterium]MDW8260767.1 hypothetical protein [Gammaproteobacteria bacterium]
MAFVDSHQCNLKIGSTIVGQIMSYTLDYGNRSTRDRTTLNDTAFKATDTGLLTLGTAQFQLLLDFNDAGQRQVVAAFHANTVQNWTIEHAGATPDFTFSGKVAQFQVRGDRDSDVQATLTIQLTTLVSGFPAP